MSEVFVIPHELKDDNEAVFKIIEGKEKEKLISMKVSNIDYHFLTDLFEEAEMDNDVPLSILKVNIEEECLISEVM